MHFATVALLATVGCCLLFAVSANDDLSQQEVHAENFVNENIQEVDDTAHVRQKRTLLLKKKLIGAGLLGFGLGIAKGYKAAYYSAPEVHHVYLSPPPAPTKYIEYVEKPVYIEKIVERPPYGAW